MIKLFRDKESLSIGAAGLFIECAEESIEKKNAFTVALSGGSTPKRTYEILASPPYRDRINWEKTNIFWGDERCVSICDERSNCRMAFDTLLDNVPVPRENLHPILCEDNPEKGAAEYEKLLRKFFRGRPPAFDLVLLGLGENGHTASLFPETGILQESNKLASSLHVQEDEYHRVSLTANTINQAAVIAFLVSGASKASVLRDVLEGPQAPRRLPAQLIRPVRGELIWMIDRSAGSLLASAPQ